jgi:hypothetical protein
MMNASVDPPLLGEVSAEAGDDIAGTFVGELRRSRDEVLETHGSGDPSFYDKLHRDDQVMPCFLQRRAEVIAREVKVDPGGDAPIDKEAADFIREQMKSISWDRTTWKMLGKLMNGFGVAECILKVSTSLTGARIELDAVKVRRSGRFRFARDGSLRLMRFGMTPCPLPPRKFWVFTAGAEDDDDLYGRGLGHWLYWPVWFKRNGIKFWATFLERFAQGTPLATVPRGTTKAQREEFLTLLGAMINGGRIAVPQGVDVKLLEAARDSGGDFEKFVARMDAAIAKIILTQTMSTDNGSSLSQGEVHERKGVTVSQTDSDLVTESWERGPVTWLTEWNFPGAKVPKVYRDFSQAQDLKARVERDKVLKDMGYRLKPDRVVEIYGDDYLYEEPPPAAPAPVVGGALPAFAEPPRDASSAVEELVANGGWKQVLGPEVDAIEGLLNDAGSLEEVRKRLDELALREPSRLVDGLARVMFAARVQGAAGAEPTPEETAANEDAAARRAAVEGERS